MTFELLDPITATLTSVTNRTETHGDEKVPAISLGLKITTSNFILDKLSSSLRPTFYTTAENEAQKTLDGQPAPTPKLRQGGIEEVKLKGALEGWTIAIEHGIDESDPITLGSCKVDGFRVTPHQDGIVDLFLRIGTSAVEPEQAGLLWAKNGQEITVQSLLAPKRKDDAQPKATDGGAPLFESEQQPADPRKPGAAERAAVAKAGGDPGPAPAHKGDDAPLPLANGGTLSPEAAWPFPKNKSTEAPPQSATTEVVIERSQPGTRTARGRDKTRAALAKGQVQ